MAGSLFRTPDEYLAATIDRLQANSSQITDFNIGSSARNLLEATGTALSIQSAIAEQHRLDSYLATATGDALTLKAADNGVDRKAAVQATGTIRITRSTTGTAVTIPAGWSPLSTVPAPGLGPVTYETLDDAVFAIGVSAVVVSARAVIGGVSGNITQGPTADTPLLPVNPVSGFNTATDFTARGAFVDGVDAETDDQLRTRVPLAVQGRVKGRVPAFLAAALGIPGVSSAQVRQAGESKIGGTVGAGEIQIYYEGSTSLLGAVTTACDDASTANQNIVVTRATDVPVTADLTVFVVPGTDHGLTVALVRPVITQVVLGAGVGEKARFSRAVTSVHTIDVVQSMTIPFADFRKTSASDNTCGDIDPGVGGALTITDATIAVTVTDLA